MHLDIRDRRRHNATARDYAAHRVDTALGRISGRIGQVIVRLDDANGDRGGVDQRARISVWVPGQPTVHVEEVGLSAEAAIDRAVERAREALKRTHARTLGRRAFQPPHRSERSARV